MKTAKEKLVRNDRTHQNWSLFQDNRTANGTSKDGLFCSNGVSPLQTSPPFSSGSYWKTANSSSLLPNLEARRYQLDKFVLRCVMSHFEEIFGLSLDCDVFGNEKDSLLPLFGRSNVNNDQNLLCFGNPELLSEVITFVKLQKAIAVFVVPDWSTHDWHRQLAENATHRFVLPVGSVRDDWFPTGSSSAFVWDARYDNRVTALISLKIPPVDVLSCKSWPPRQILSTYDFTPPPVKRRLNVAWFLQWGRGLPDKMLSTVTQGIIFGFPTHYRGGGKFLRDYSSTLPPDDEKRAVDKAAESVANGWAAGPFDRIPFPNGKCPHQAIVTKLFTIPKHKWANDGKRRLIFHKSFPKGESINAITPRHDAATFFPPGFFHYLTLAKILAIITKAGKGCLIITFDAKDAYKQLYVKLEDLYQQVFKAGGKFYVDLCASFGALYGNDSYSTFAYVHCFCLAAATGTVGWLFQYVDNYILIVPCSGKTTTVRASLSLLCLRREVARSGLHTHEWVGPAHKVTFIGWEIDTLAFRVSITTERREFMIKHLLGWGSKVSATVSELSSLVGLLIFLSQIIGGIKATIGVLILERTALQRRSKTTFIVSERIRSSIAHIAFVLEKWSGHAIIFDRCWQDSSADITVYCDIAKDKTPTAGSFGKGAFSLPHLKYYSEPWTDQELRVAMREKTHSTTHLELLNMLKAVLKFAGEAQKILCYCDNKAAVAIARARYSETANLDIEERLRFFDVACCERNLVVRFRWQGREFPLPKLADELSRGKVAPHMQPLDAAPVLFYRSYIIVCFRSTTRSGSKNQGRLSQLCDFVETTRR